MNKISISLLSGMMLATMVPAVNADDTGTITFNATITDASCVVPADQLTRTINLATITPESLSNAAAGEKMTSTPMSFDFTSCPATASNVGIKFDYTADAAHSDYMANTGDASGVLLGITDSADVLQPNNATVLSSDFDAATGSGTVNAKVAAYRVGTEAPVAGDIASQATVTVVMQ